MQTLEALLTLAGMVGILYGGHRLLQHYFDRHQMDMIRSALLLAFLILGGCFARR